MHVKVWLRNFGKRDSITCSGSRKMKPAANKENPVTGESDFLEKTKAYSTKIRAFPMQTASSKC